MGLDALRTSHAIAVDVKHPSEIGQLFDSISYSKGARYPARLIITIIQ
jgi:aminopeptidase N